VNSSIIIGFGHKARNGKDTAVNAIIEARGGQYDIRRYAFADELRSEIAGQEANLCQKHGVKYEPDNRQRALCQFWGMYRRKNDPFYWVNKVAARINTEKPQFALISDLRFENERIYIKSEGGITVRVIRLGFVNFAIDPNHISEVALDNAEFDFTISASSVDELKSSAVEMFDTLVKEMDNTDALREVVEGLSE